jgi:hypothetical protein
VRYQLAIVVVGALLAGLINVAWVAFPLGMAVGLAVREIGDREHRAEANRHGGRTL